MLPTQILMPAPRNAGLSQVAVSSDVAGDGRVAASCAPACPTGPPLMTRASAALLLALLLGTIGLLDTCVTPLPGAGVSLFFHFIENGWVGWVWTIPWFFQND